MTTSRTVLTAVSCLALGVSALGASGLAAPEPASAATGPALQRVSGLTPVGDEVFFLASDAEHGRALWKSDGTADGTGMVAVINPTDTPTPGGGAAYGGSAAVGERLFFSSDDGTHGVELWVSDGTTTGTHLVRDVHPGAPGSQLDELVGHGHTLFFTLAGAKATRLWKSDGTEAGTVRVRSRDKAPVDPAELYPWQRSVFFVAGERGVGAGKALWKSDGTARGTRMVKDVRPGANLDPHLRHFAGGDTRLYFAANDGRTMGDDNTGIWRTDGTRAGTTYVRNVSPLRYRWDEPRPEPEQLTTLGDRLLFTDNDCTHGQEPWSSNGTFKGTRILDLDPRTGTCGASSEPKGLIVLRDAFFLVARVDGRNTLWRTDGTPKGTSPVAEIPATQWASSLFVDDVVAGDLLFLGVYNPGNQGDPPFNALWVSDGTAAGTRQVRDFTGSTDGEPIYGSYVSAGGRAFFLVRSGADGSTALWTSDGTSAGTAPLVGG